MSKPLFGQILDPDFHPTRDAVHVPIVPAIAASDLSSGESLVLHKGISGNVYAYRSVDKSPKNCIAIVDPFLRTGAKEGQLFYAWLRPDSTQRLGHEWTHRELDKVVVKDAY